MLRQIVRFNFQESNERIRNPFTDFLELTSQALLRADISAR